MDVVDGGGRAGGEGGGRTVWEGRRGAGWRRRGGGVGGKGRRGIYIYIYITLQKILINYGTKKLKKSRPSTPHLSDCVVKAHGVPDRAPHLHPHLLRHPGRHSHSSHPAWLRARHLLHAGRPPSLVQVLRDLSRLARPRLACRGCVVRVCVLRYIGAGVWGTGVWI